MIPDLRRLPVTDGIEPMSASTFGNNQSINYPVTPLILPEALLILDVPVTLKPCSRECVGVSVFRPKSLVL